MKNWLIRIFCVATVLFFALILLHVPFLNTIASTFPSEDSLARKRNFHDGPLLQDVDSILVVKRYRHMYVFNGGKLLKVYNIVLGTNPVGHKHFQGDRKTPEGLYHIDGKNAVSIAYKSLGISYPNNADRAYARSQGKPTGGDVKIHGTLNGYEAEEDEWMKSDWTWGCVAVRNKDMEELYQHVKVGAPILITP